MVPARNVNVKHTHHKVLTESQGP